MEMRAGRLELCRKGGTVATYEIIVTDVTCYGSLYCVAGWDRLTGQMIRPEPPGANAADEASRFWNAGYAGPGKTFAVGNVVTLIATDALPDFLFPHATEDRIVDMGKVRGDVKSRVLRACSLYVVRRTLMAELARNTR